MSYRNVDEAKIRKMEKDIRWNNRNSSVEEGMEGMKELEKLRDTHSMFGMFNWKKEKKILCKKHGEVRLLQKR